MPVQSRHVLCLRCKEVIAVDFDLLPTGLLYCIGCEAGVRSGREQYERDKQRRRHHEDTHSDICASGADGLR